ncbi:MAG: serine/threonine transporter SstT [Lachnospiraceae bacterium]|nr:serine/threonine transporter SstT [Lachnospiraceae bacterium]
MKQIVDMWNKVSLIAKIAVGIVIGATLGMLVPAATGVGLIGTMFVRALKAIAPILVFVLVISSIANAGKGNGKQFRMITLMYILSTLLAAVVAVSASFIFPVKMTLDIESYQADVVPSGIVEVLENLLLNITDNPIRAMIDANYLCILAWALLLGLAMRRAEKSVRCALVSVSDAVAHVVRWIIGCAPFGIMGLVFTTVSESGLSIFREYGKLLLVLVGAMLMVALVVDPLLASFFLKKNAYPLALRCLRESGVTAFFTRSSAANIPVNMTLCKRLGLDPDVYSVSIPLGATINMDGAAITITIMALSVANTMSVSVDLPTAFMLSMMATLGACGASGVAGGSLLLIPMACSLFGIPQDISMQAVAVGMIIGVVQDSLETAINSSGDVLFAATAEYRQWQKEGKEFKIGAIVNSDEEKSD